MAGATGEITDIIGVVLNGTEGDTLNAYGQSSYSSRYRYAIGSGSDADR